MAQSVGSINVELKANTATFVTGMSKAAYAAKQAGSDIKKSFAELGDVAKVALAPFGELSVVAGEAFKSIGNLAGNASKSLGEFGATAAVMVGGMAAAAGAVIAVGAAMAKLAIDGSEVIERFSLISQKTGISIRDLQSFEAAGDTVGVSLEDMVTGMRKFDQALTGTSKQAALAKVVLQQLGVTSKDPKEAILEVADAFSKMKDGTIKGAEAIALFGKSGLQLIPFLNLGRTGFLEATDAVAKFGPVISGPALAATEKWKESTRDLKLAWETVTTGLTANVLPNVAKFVELIAEATKGIADLADAFGSNPIFQEIVNPKPWFGPGSLPEKQVAANAPGTFETEEHSKEFFPMGGLDVFKRQAAEAYDVLKAGSAAANELEKKRIELQGWEMINNYGVATLIHAQVEQLERVVALEQQRRKEEERILASKQGVAAALARQGAGGAIPLFPLDRPAQLAQGAAAPAPDTVIPDAVLDAVRTSLGNVISGSLTEGTAIGLAKLQEFYDKFKSDNKKAIDFINEDSNNWMNTFIGLLANGEINEKQFADVSVAIEQDRLKKILKSRDEEARTWDEEALKMFSFRDKTAAILDEIGRDGEHLGGKIFESFHKAIDDLSGKLAQLVVTGKANFKELFQSLAESIAKSGIQSLFGQAAKGIASKFGLQVPGLGKKPTGAAGDPLYVAFDTGAVGMRGLGGLFGGKSVGAGPIGSAEDAGYGYGGDSGAGGALSSFTSKMSSIFSSIFSSISGVLSKVVSGIGSGISSIGSFFSGLGFLAAGGDVTPGRAYVVGEKHPEFFIPRQPGHVAPALSMGGGTMRTTVVHNHFHGVTDMDTFRRSEGQIMAKFQHTIAVAHARNY